MEKSKLISLVATLSKSEFREFGKYLEGVPYQKTGGVYKLYKYLKTHHPDLPAKYIDKDYIQKKLYKTTNNPKKHLYDNISQLSISLEDFLIKKRLETNTDTKNLLLLEVYKERQLDGLFFQKINAIEKQWDKKQVPGIKHLYDEYNLKRTCLMHPNFSVLNKEKAPENLTVLIELLDKFYFAAKLHWTMVNNATNNFVNASKKEKSQFFIEDIIKYSSLEQFQATPQIKFLSKFTEAIHQRSFDNYIELKNDFFKNLSIYDESEKYDIFIMLGACFNNSNHPNSFNELFELNRFGVEQRLLFENGYLSADYFINIVNVAGKVNELDWAEEFIKDYQVFIAEKYQKDIALFCESTLCSLRNDFNGALEKLHQIEKYHNVFCEILAKCTQLQCYYELDFDDSFEALTKSFSKFLKSKNTINDSFRENFLKFIFYAKELKKDKDSKNKENNEVLKKIETEPYVPYQFWLLNKFKDLKG